MALLTKEQILRVKDIETRTVNVPEWGGDVLVRSLSATERDYFESKLVDQSGGKVRANLQNIKARLASMAIADEDGNRVFTEQEIAILGTKSAAALNRISEAITDMSGISKKDMDELAGNSEAMTSEGSLSA
jgi:hypothetical protein